MFTPKSPNLTQLDSAIGWSPVLTANQLVSEVTNCELVEIVLDHPRLITTRECCKRLTITTLIHILSCCYGDDSLVLSQWRELAGFRMMMQKKGSSLFNCLVIMQNKASIRAL